MKWIPLLAAALLSGCMASLETREDVITEAKALTPISPDTATVYVIRDFRAYPNDSISAYLKESEDTSQYAQPINLLPRSFGRTAVAPGSYKLYANALTMSAFDNGPEKVITLAAGDVAIYKLTPESSWSGTVFFLDKLSPKQARSIIEQKELSLVK